MNRTNHRIYRYSGFWYAECAQCPRTMSNSSWRTVKDLLEFHIREHGTLDRAPSTRSY